MRYQITIIVESEEDPSAILDAVEYAVQNGGIGDDVRLDPKAEEDGKAVSVEPL